MVESTDIPTQICPGCGYEFDVASDFKGAKPEPTDTHYILFICIKCGQPMRYLPGGAVESLTVEDLMKVRKEDPGFYETVERYRDGIEKMNAQKDSKGLRGLRVDDDGGRRV